MLAGPNAIVVVVVDAAVELEGTALGLLDDEQPAVAKTASPTARMGRAGSVTARTLPRSTRRRTLPSS